MKPAILFAILFLGPLSWATNTSGFNCLGSQVYFDGASDPIITFPNDDSCQTAVAHANEGFVCNGTDLFSIGVRTSLATYPNPDICGKAVQNAKNGFICAGAVMYRRGALIRVLTFNKLSDCLDNLNTRTF